MLSKFLQKISLLLTIIIAAVSPYIKAQEPVLFTDLNNRWIIRTDPYGPCYFSRCGSSYHCNYTDSIYYEIDSFKYTKFIDDGFLYGDYYALMRYDSTTGIVYGRSLNGIFGNYYEANDSAEFVVMRKDAQVGDKFFVPSYFTDSIEIIDIFKKPLSYFDSYYGRNKIFTDLTIDSITVYTFRGWYITGSFNFVSGFSNFIQNFNMGSVHHFPESAYFIHGRNYTPEEAAQNCKSISDSLNILNTKNILSDNSVQIYPNPATDQIHINTSLPLDDTYTIKIYNAIGQIVYHAPAVTSKNINIASYPSGIYLIYIEQSGAVSYSKRFLKQ